MADPSRSSQQPAPKPDLWETIWLPSLANVLIALLVASLVAGLAAALVLTRSASYRSSATILLDQRDIAREPSPLPIQRLNALRSKYAALVPTEEIAGRVADELGLSQPEVAGSASVVFFGDSLVMYSTATAGDPGATRRLAQAVAEEVIAFASREQADAAVPEEERVTLRIVDPARPGTKISPTTADAMSNAALAGGIALAGSYVFLQLLTAGRRAVGARAG